MVLPKELRDPILNECSTLTAQSGTDPQTVLQLVDPYLSNSSVPPRSRYCWRLLSDTHVMLTDYHPQSDELESLASLHVRMLLCRGLETVTCHIPGSHWYQTDRMPRFMYHLRRRASTQVSSQPSSALQSPGIHAAIRLFRFIGYQPWKPLVKLRHSSGPDTKARKHDRLRGSSAGPRKVFVRLDGIIIEWRTCLLLSAVTPLSWHYTTELLQVVSFHTGCGISSAL